MFNKTRIERIFKYLVDDEQRIEQHEVEIMELKARVTELEERKCHCEAHNDRD